jgi:exopolysaccharide biosynthesis polyprenyl glycosylphosphotransferase
MYKKYQGNVVPEKKSDSGKTLLVIYLVFALHLICDFISVFFSYSIAHFLRFHFFVESITYHRFYDVQSVYYSLCFSITLLLLYSFFGMYDGYKKIRRTPILKKTIICNAIMIGLVAIILYFTKKTHHMRSFFAMIFLVNIIVNFTLRFVINTIVSTIRKRTGHLTHPCLLIGNNEKSEYLDNQLTHKSKKHLFRIIERLPTPHTDEDWEKISEKISSGEFSVVLYIDEHVTNDAIAHVIRLCTDSNVALKILAPQFLTFHNPFSFGDYIDGIPLVHFSSHYFSNKFKFLRAILSRMLGVVCVIIASPVLLFGYLIVKLASRGPALFIQERCGYNCLPFRMFKFRTMYVGADKIVEKLRQEKNDSDGGLFKLKNDPRIFPMGGFLRKFSIDELPQLFNVVKGEMRLVGPRPLPMTDLKYFVSDWHYLRHISVPGLTCIWQVSGRSNIKFEEMCMLDIWYSLNKNWVMDIKLVFLTVSTILFDRGAY